MPRFVVLDFARFVLAVLVALMHWHGWAAPRKAYLAVDFFFILSGFVLCIANADRADREGFFGRFMVDRVARLYPLHLATLLLLIPINTLFYFTSGGVLLEQGWSYSDGRPYSFLLNFFMLQNVGLNTDGSWNAPSWSISAEFYVNVLLACALVYYVTKARHVFIYALTVAIVSYVAAYAAFGNLAVIYERAFGIMNAGLLRGLAGISLGIVCFGTYNAIKSAPWAAPAAFASGTICAALLLVFTALPYGDFVILPFIFMFILSTALYERQTPVPEGKARTWMIELGALSYAVYLVHWPMLTFSRYQLWYAWHIPINFKTPLAAIIFISLVIIVAYFTYHKFELPMKIKVKQWLSAKQFARS